MYLVESKGGAIGCMLLALFFLGTWPAIIALLERRGRCPQHTYLDYTFTNLLAAIIIAFSLGEIGPSTIKRPNFLAQLSQLITKKKLETYSNGTKDDGTNDAEKGATSPDKAKFGTALYLIDLENKRAIKTLGKSTIVGLALTFFAGICFSLFSPAFNLATNDQWHTLKEGVPHLTVYTAFFYFSVSCFVLALILNLIFLYHPVLDAPKSSIKAYLNDWNGRGLALLAGFICGFGNGLQFMGGQAAGYAAADAVQALPLVSTFWGILLFGEYRRSSRKTYTLLVGMLTMFIAAVGILMASQIKR